MGHLLLEFLIVKRNFGIPKKYDEKIREKWKLEGMKEKMRSGDDSFVDYDKVAIAIILQPPFATINRIVFFIVQDNKGKDKKDFTSPPYSNQCRESVLDSFLRS